MGRKEETGEKGKEQMVTVTGQGIAWAAAAPAAQKDLQRETLLFNLKMQFKHNLEKMLALTTRYDNFNTHYFQLLLLYQNLQHFSSISDKKTKQQIPYVI